MNAFRWKLLLTTAAAVAIPCFVLAENSASPRPAQQTSDAQLAADKEHGSGGPATRPGHEEMHRHERPMVKGAYLGISAQAGAGRDSGAIQAGRGDGSVDR